MSWDLMGKEATARNCLREKDGSDRGPLPNAKSKSLKFASQEMEKAKVPARCTEWRARGSARKRHRMGSIARSIGKPFGTDLPLA